MNSNDPPHMSSKEAESRQNILPAGGPDIKVSPTSGSRLPMEIGRGGPETSPTQVITETGDLILEYTGPQNPGLVAPRLITHSWRVSSEDLIRNSPYFSALLDPNKFSEGQYFMNQKALQDHQPKPDKGATLFGNSSPQREVGLPTIRLPANHFSADLGLDSIELFLRILSYDSLNEEMKPLLDAELRIQRSSLIARLIALADAFNSLQVVQAALKRSGYALGKPKAPLTRFTSSMLKMSEERIRQIIFIAKFIDERTIFQILTHTLIVTGSKFWVNGIERPDSVTYRWNYFPDGLEEELYFRRQCVLNTITDLQAYFLRIYGALEEPIISKHSIPNPSIAATVIQSREYQCRCGLGNSSACDAFHLGQMTRFFALRTKTIFLGSTLIDPDFDPDITDSEEEVEGGSKKEEENAPSRSLPRQPPSDITAIISSLKQCPDYQVDTSHTGCGIRRRLLPPLDCIEGFVGDDRGLLGVKLSQFPSTTSEMGVAKETGEGQKKLPSHIAGSWTNRSLRRALVIDIRLARIGGVPVMSPGKSGLRSREEDARLLFTAKKRNWEA